MAMAARSRGTRAWQYRSGDGSLATSASPARNRSATLSQRGRADGHGEPGRRSGRVEGDATDAARAEMRPDRRPDEVDAHARGIDATGHPGLQLRHEVLDTGIRRVEHRQPLYRAGAQQLDDPLPGL